MILNLGTNCALIPTTARYLPMPVLVPSSTVRVPGGLASDLKLAMPQHRSHAQPQLKSVGNNKHTFNRIPMNVSIAGSGMRRARRCCYAFDCCYTTFLARLSRQARKTWRGVYRGAEVARILGPYNLSIYDLLTFNFCTLSFVDRIHTLTYFLFAVHTLHYRPYIHFKERTYNTSNSTYIQKKTVHTYIFV